MGARKPRGEWCSAASPCAAPLHLCLLVGGLTARAACIGSCSPHLSNIVLCRLLRDKDAHVCARGVGNTGCCKVEIGVYRRGPSHSHDIVLRCLGVRVRG